MNNYQQEKPKRPSKNYKVDLKHWKKNLMQRGKLDPRLNARGLIVQESLKALASAQIKPVEHGATAAQMELNKKRDVEVIKLHKDLEESKIQGESSIAGMKRKQTDSVSEMTGQIDQLTKMKSK